MDACISARSPAHQLYELFRGAETRHGTYDPARLRLVGSKMEMKDAEGQGPRDVKAPPTVDLWERHLDGLSPLGISPLREDGLCRWGVVDIDEYDGFDLTDLARRILQNNLPLILTKSKSGGGHVWLFADDWISQSKMNAALVAIAGRLGYSDAETYPPASGTGNWINMPFWEGDKSSRCGIKPSGLAMTVAEFINAAQASRTSAQAIELLANKGRAAFSSRAHKRLAERCAEIVALTDGRKRALHDSAFYLGKYVLKGQVEAAEVEERLIAAGVASGVAFIEAELQVQNGLKGRIKKQAGTNGDDADAEFDRFADIEKIVILTGGEENLWRITVADYGEVIMPSRIAFRSEQFNLRCAEELHVAFRQLSKDKWADRLNAALLVAETEALPRDETVEGIFFDALQAFCTDRHRGAEVEETLLGKPVVDDESGRTYFRFADFRAFLVEIRHGMFKGMTGHSIGRMLGAIGQEGVDVGKTTKKLKAKITELRWVRTGMFDGSNAVMSIPLPEIEAMPL